MSVHTTADFADVAMAQFSSIPEADAGAAVIEAARPYIDGLFEERDAEI
jgi:hypothetical protein